VKFTRVIQPKPKVSEKDIQTQCLAWLKLRRVMAWRQNSGAMKTAAGGYVKFSSVDGQSDIIGLLPGGKFLAVEVKSSRGQLRDNQEAFLAAVTAMGGVAGVVRSLDELIELVEPLLPQMKLVGSQMMPHGTSSATSS
jgi:hypothetical protein